MRKALIFKIFNIVILTTLVIGLLSSYSFADDPAKKFCRGALNATTAIFEIPANIFKTAKEEGAGMGATYGAVKGAFRFVQRTAVGILEMINFPFPVPKDYEPIMTDPEYFFGKEEREEIE